MPWKRNKDRKNQKHNTWEERINVIEDSTDNIHQSDSSKVQHKRIKLQSIKEKLGTRGIRHQFNEFQKKKQERMERNKHSKK